jgi:hypothetical protein
MGTQTGSPFHGVIVYISRTNKMHACHTVQQCSHSSTTTHISHILALLCPPVLLAGALLFTFLCHFVHLSPFFSLPCPQSPWQTRNWVWREMLVGLSTFQQLEDDDRYDSYNSIKLASMPVVDRYTIENAYFFILLQGYIIYPGGVRFCRTPPHHRECS